MFATFPAGVQTQFVDLNGRGAQEYLGPQGAASAPHAHAAGTHAAHGQTLVTRQTGIMQPALAWNLKAWWALLLPVAAGRWRPTW
jgi:hypothetical protein